MHSTFVSSFSYNSELDEPLLEDWDEDDFGGATGKEKYISFAEAYDERRSNQRAHSRSGSPEL